MNQYFIRIKLDGMANFEGFLYKNEIDGRHVSTDMSANSSAVYTVTMDSSEALNLKLTLPYVIGIMELKDQ